MQEDLIKASGTPYTIIRSTQFLEFVPTIAAIGTQGNDGYVSDISFQPIAAADVAAFVTEFALEQPTNALKEIAGPEKDDLINFVTAYLKQNDSAKKIIPTDKHEYFGATIAKSALVPEGSAHLGKVAMKEWLSEKII